MTYVERLPDGTLLAVSADDPGPRVATENDFAPLCARCLLDEHPEAGLGIEVALEEGVWSA